MCISFIPMEPEGPTGEGKEVHAALVGRPTTRWIPANVLCASSEGKKKSLSFYLSFQSELSLFFFLSPSLIRPPISGRKKKSTHKTRFTRCFSG